jgi:hypothetical protein
MPDNRLIECLRMCGIDAGGSSQSYGRMLFKEFVDPIAAGLLSERMQVLGARTDRLFAQWFTGCTEVAQSI